MSSSAQRINPADKLAIQSRYLIHYETSEIVKITDDESVIVLNTEQDDFFAEISLSGYHCDQATTITESAGAEPVKVHGKDGVIVLQKG